MDKLLLIVYQVSLFGIGHFQDQQHGHTSRGIGHQGIHIHRHGGAGSDLHVDHNTKAGHRDIHTLDIHTGHRGRHPNELIDRHGRPHGNRMDIHVDKPGEHDNNSPFSVIHRPHGPHSGGKPHKPHGPHVMDIHVDRPGEHGNNSPFAVIHRSDKPHTPHGGVGDRKPHGGRPHKPHGPHVTDIHVDRPGEHGNNSPFAVIHRSDEPHTPHGGIGDHKPHGGRPNKGPHVTDIHVDRPGEHGNNSPFAVIHRSDEPHTPHGGVGDHKPHGGRPHKPHEIHVTDIHVDRPGEHGNNSPFAVIHRSDKPHTPHGGVGDHEPHGGKPHKPYGPHVGVGRHKPHNPLVADTHVDKPGVQGNNSPFAVIHRPTQPNGHNGGSSPHLETNLHKHFNGGNTASHPVVHKTHVSDRGNVHRDLTVHHEHDSRQAVIPSPVGGTSDVQDHLAQPPNDRIPTVTDLREPFLSGYPFVPSSRGVPIPPFEIPPPTLEPIVYPRPPPGMYPLPSFDPYRPPPFPILRRYPRPYPIVIGRPGVRGNRRRFGRRGRRRRARQMSRQFNAFVNALTRLLG